MTRPRSQLVSLKSTPYYHCISRCVRRAFLCGKDSYTGKNFDHRKPWLTKRLKFLAEVFSIDIAAYAVMSNHYHLVLHIDKNRSRTWSDKEVIRRWRRIFKGPALLQHTLPQPHSEENDQTRKLVRLWRKRLSNISWFMRCLNEYIARKANLEDDCTGRFWEGRFKSTALLDETALLSCMTYVDLNPIRSGLASNLANSDFTSIQDRIKLYSHRDSGTSARYRSPDFSGLMPFQDLQRADQTQAILPCSLNDYLELVEWTGRIIKPDKPGFLDMNIPSLVTTLNLSPLHWQLLAQEIQKRSISLLNGLKRISVLKRKSPIARAS